MLKKYELEEIIEKALSELNGRISDSPNEDGLHDLYLANTETDNNNDIILTFDTYRNNEKIDTDKYKIKIEYIR